MKFQMLVAVSALALVVDATKFRLIVQSIPLLTGFPQYFVQVVVGSSPLLMLFDTGSSTIWSKCLLRKQEIGFYTPVSPFAKLTYCGADHPCRFNATYADGSFAAGILFTDFLHMGDYTTYTRLGCAIDGIQMIDSYPFMSGIMGFNSKSDILVNKISFFSYCIHPGPGSYIHILEEKTGIILAGFSQAPLKIDHSGLYGTSMSGVSLQAGSEGGMEPFFPIILDTGTIKTYVSQRKIVQFIEEAMGDILDGSGCFPQARKIVHGPSIYFNLDGGNMKVDHNNYMYFAAEKGRWCLAIEVANDGVQVLGSLMQQGQTIVIDTVDNILSFKKTDCLY